MRAWFAVEAMQPKELPNILRIILREKDDAARNALPPVTNEQLVSMRESLDADVRASLCWHNTLGRVSP